MIGAWLTLAKASYAIKSELTNLNKNVQVFANQKKGSPTMAEHEWLCMMMLSLDDFASAKKLKRFRKALSDAADAVLVDIEEASDATKNVIPFRRSPAGPKGMVSN